MRIQNYLRPHVAYTNRIRPSTRIRFVSGHLKGLVNRARAEKDWFWYCDVRVYKNIRIRASTRIRIHSVYRNFHSGERIQKSPDTPSVYGGHVWTLGVSAYKKIGDTNVSGYVWTMQLWVFRVSNVWAEIHHSVLRYLRSVGSGLLLTPLLIRVCRQTKLIQHCWMRLNSKKSLKCKMLTFKCFSKMAERELVDARPSYAQKCC